MIGNLATRARGSSWPVHLLDMSSFVLHFLRVWGGCHGLISHYCLKSILRDSHHGYHQIQECQEQLCPWWWHGWSLFQHRSLSCHGGDKHSLELCSLPSTFVAVASPPIGSAIGVVMVELLSKSQQPCTCNFSLHVVSNFVESHNTPLPQSHRNITIPRISYLSCLHHAIACRKRGDSVVLY